MIKRERESVDVSEIEGFFISSLNLNISPPNS